MQGSVRALEATAGVVGNWGCHLQQEAGLLARRPNNLDHRSSLVLLGSNDIVYRMPPCIGDRRPLRDNLCSHWHTGNMSLHILEAKQLRVG